MLPFCVFISNHPRSVHVRPRPKPSATTKSVRSPRAESRQTRVQPSRLIGERLSPLECAVPQNATLSALECAVAKTGLCKSFRMRTYKKRWGGRGGVSCSSLPLYILLVASSQSHFARRGDWLQVLFVRGGRVRSDDHQNDGSKNHNGGRDRAQRDSFVRHEPAEKQRHHGIHQR